VARQLGDDAAQILNLTVSVQIVVGRDDLP